MIKLLEKQGSSHDNFFDGRQLSQPNIMVVGLGNTVDETNVDATLRRQRHATLCAPCFALSRHAVCFMGQYGAVSRFSACVLPKMQKGVKYCEWSSRTDFIIIAILIIRYQIWWHRLAAQTETQTQLQFRTLRRNGSASGALVPNPYAQDTCPIMNPGALPAMHWFRTIFPISYHISYYMR